LAAGSTTKLAPVEHQAAPLRGKIIAALRNAIETGVLQPGARLVERDLCAQLNVSRTSLREALRELQAEGILFQAGARGLSVGVVDREEAENAYRIRAVLEALAVEQFIERAGEHDLKSLVREADALKGAYRSGDVSKILVAKRRFYDRICTGAQNALAFDLINRLVLRTSSLRSRSLARKERQTQSVAEIDAIVEAIRSRDVDAARRAAAAHVNSGMKSTFSVLGDPAPGAAAEAPARPRSRSRRATSS
jgi:DNA-binding GntR family transcriptional regulator